MNKKKNFYRVLAIFKIVNEMHPRLPMSKASHSLVFETRSYNH